jgi:DNA-binding MarR family transcriptional regulator
MKCDGTPRSIAAVPADGSASELSDAGVVLALLLYAHQTVHAALEAEMRKHLGIGVRDHDVLRALAAAPDGQLRMLDIADRLCISRSGVTQSVDRLENLGLVSRVTTHCDRRLVLAETTPEGRSLASTGQQIIEAVACRFVTETLTDGQVAALASSLAKVAAASPTFRG